MTRREVRVSDSFFTSLDAQLGPERGANGEPSSTDFLILDLPRAVEQFAARFDQLPSAIEGIGAARMLIGTGALVSAYVIFGVETANGVVELVHIDLDL